MAEGTEAFIPWDGQPLNRDLLKENIRRHHRVLNRLESHLGCVVCRGPLTEGVCPTCDPKQPSVYDCDFCGAGPGDCDCGGAE